MNTLFIILLSFLLFTDISISSTIEETTIIPKRHLDLERKLLNKEYPNTNQCLFDRSIKKCQTIDNTLRCPSITECSNKLAEMNIKNNSAILIPAGNYNASYCPFNVNPSLFAQGEVIITSINGSAYFNCHFKRFLFLKAINSPIDLVINGISMSGSNSLNGGCMSIVSASTTGSSSLYVYNSQALSCHTDTQGGFLYTNALTVLLINTTVIGCTAGQNGGAIYTLGGSSLYIMNSTYNNNLANGNGNVMSGLGGVVFGSHLYVYGSNFTANSGAFGGVFQVSSASIFKSNFTDNQARNFGGVFYMDTPNAITNVFDEVIFENNNASSGGCIVGGNMTVTNSIFIGNQANGYGGSILCYYGMGSSTGICDLFNTSFTNGFAFYGGSIAIQDMTLLANDCVFSGNVADQDGGAIYTINQQHSQTIQIGKSSIYQNQATNGGAIYIVKGKEPLYLNLMDSELVENVATKYGGAIYWNEELDSFIGGVFSGSKSSESSSMTFWSQSIKNVNIVSFSNVLPYYSVPIFDETSFKYWKVFGAHGNCTNGVATINEEGYVLTCKQSNHHLSNTAIIQ